MEIPSSTIDRCFLRGARSRRAFTGEERLYAPTLIKPLCRSSRCSSAEARIARIERRRKGRRERDEKEKESAIRRREGMPLTRTSHCQRGGKASSSSRTTRKRDGLPSYRRSYRAPSKLLGVPPPTVSREHVVADNVNAQTRRRS